LNRFKELQDEVEKEDANLESLLESKYEKNRGSGDEMGGGTADISMEGGMSNSGVWY
jgi:hypothetical protein